MLIIEINLFFQMKEIGFWGQFDFVGDINSTANSNHFKC